MSKLLELNNIKMNFGGVKAVDNLSFDVLEDEIVGLIGPNGAGKTTVFNCITQFYKNYEGEILFKNKNDELIDLRNIKVTNVIKQGLVRTFQNVELVKDLSILDNVLIGGHSEFKATIFENMLRLFRSNREERRLKQKAIEILKFLNLDKMMYQYAYGQPYGILKKIEIARTLMANPKLIILDEPAAGLNEDETQELRILIKKIKEEYKCSIILIEHDMSFVMNICDRICAISFGKFLAMGTPKEIQNDPLVQEAYLGKEDDE